MMGGVNDTNEEGGNGQGLSSIVGADNLTPVDTVLEGGVTKLHVKSSIVPSALGDQFFLKALDGASDNLAVNGSSTPVEFIISAESGAGAKDLIVEELRFSSFDNQISINGFMGEPSITNGLDIEITNNSGDVFSFLPIMTTAEFDSHFAFGRGGKFFLITGQSNYMSATYSPVNPFVLKKDTGDQIKITVSDDIDKVTSMEFIAFGFKQAGA